MVSDMKSAAKTITDRHPLSNGQGQGRMKRGPKPHDLTVIWRYVEITTPDKCWLFKLKSRNRKGYGRICIDQRLWLPHVVAYIVTKGPLPANKPFVLHRCNTPLCCNPAHLYAGTHKQNMRDARANGKIGGFRGTTPEIKAKISATMKLRRAENPDWGKI